MDWPGALLLGLGLVGMVLALSNGAGWGWTSTRTLVALVGGAVLLAGWVVVELRTNQPLMDLRYLFRPRLAPIFLIGFLLYFAYLGSQVPNATFLALPVSRLGHGLGLTPVGISMAFVSPFLAATVLAALTSRIGRVIGYPRTVALGTVLFVGVVGLVFDHRSLVAFIVLNSISGAGFGLIEGATRTIVVDELRDGEISVGEGIYELSIGLGSAFGRAVVAAILTAHTTPHTQFVSEHGYEVVWSVLAAAGVVGAVTATAYAVFRRKSTPQTDSRVVNVESRVRNSAPKL
jgi:MFS family permease